MRVGADTGGTFTDVVSADGSVLKVPSTPVDPGEAVRSGLDSLAGAAGARPSVLAHGTTVATNALLERQGATVALVTTEGLSDVIEIARQDRPSLYDAGISRPDPLVPRHLRFEVVGRLGPDGTELEPSPAAEDIPSIPDGAEAVAVCLLHSDLDPRHESAVAQVLMDRGHDVTCSHEVSPEYREYERTVTTVVNAYLRPRCRSYLRGLAGAADRVVVMTSAGGLIPSSEAGDVPAGLLLSGPAGGVRAAADVAVACGWPDAISFDMGGTSTDVCLVRDGRPEPAAQREAAGLPIRLPALHVLTIGAGGGSIARLDAGGALAVGPRSAGAVPGPACYGRGGREPTVTDADLVLGRIPAAASFPGLGTLDAAAAAEALDRAGVDAGGVVRVVDAGMERALRAVSVERGVDPRSLALVAFGGAGPLHACALAEALGMPAVIVPARAGVLSAVGLLCSAEQRDLVRSWPAPLDHRGLGEALEDLQRHAVELVGAGTDDKAAIEVEQAVDCRYAGQSHEITVPRPEDFPAEHLRRNGFDRPGEPVEVIALRARATAPVPLGVGSLPEPPRRQATAGPAVIAETDCTIWVPDGWRAEPGPAGALVITRSGDG